MLPPLQSQDRDQLLDTARRLLAEAQALSSRISAVNEVATAINQTLDIDQIIRVVGKQAKWLLDFDHLSIYLKTRTSHRLITLTDTRHGPSREENPDWVQYTLIARAMSSKQAQLSRRGSGMLVRSTSEVAKLSLTAASFLSEYPAQIAIPLQSEGEALGTLNFASMTQAAYTQEDTRIGYLLALQLGAAIRNADRFQELNLLNAALDQEKRRSDALLLNILPSEVADELKMFGTVEPTEHPEVTVMFTDFVRFTEIAALLSPRALVKELDACFSYFDQVIGRHGLEKLKTIGDSYMCVAGIPTASPTHAADAVRAALQILQFMQARQEEKARAGEPMWGIRIGIHSGSLVAGVIGQKKYAYDVWGDTVNTAARIEQASVGGRINMSASTYALVKDQFACEPRGRITVKDGRDIEMYFVCPPVQPEQTT